MARRYALDGRLGKIQVRGAGLSAQIADAVSTATLSMSTTEVTQLDLVVVDDDRFQLLRSGLFAPGTPTKRGAHVRYADLNLEVRAVELSPRGEDHAIRVTARSIGAGNLKRARGALVRRDLTPTQFLALEAKKAGLKFVGQPSAKRKQIARQAGGKGKGKGESSWDTAQRLATELGFVCFEHTGTLFFGKPTWLVERKAAQVMRVAWRGAKTSDALDALPVCRRTGDDEKRLATVDAPLRGDLAELARPGMAFVLDGVPTFDGRYMVDRVTLDLSENAPARVEASTPINPVPQPPPKPPKKKAAGGGGGGSSSAGGGGATGARSAAAFVATALSQAGKSYVYAAEASGSDPDPNAFDCSELVEWALARVGVGFVDGSSAQIAACKSISVSQAMATRGALLWHPGHIAISLGNGKTIEAANPGAGVVSYGAAGRFQRGGLVPGLRY